MYSTLKIGFWGLSFNSGNMGCNALSYSFLNILNKISKKRIQVYIFFQGENADFSSLSTKSVSLISAAYNPRSIISIFKLIKNIKNCDLSFDFTAGDSFSDIYGLKGFVKSCAFKKLAMTYSKKFILGPQTYGPYKYRISKAIAKHIINNADYACTRDSDSSKYIKFLFGKNLDVFTDVAFALTYQNKHTLKTSKRKIGINVSGLLWNGGYTGSNQFNLKVDYRTYISNLIEKLHEDENLEIYLIPHVISSVPNPESDYPISEEISNKYPYIHLSPHFVTPIEAKSFISEMDVFIGARMHATIGAFSTGVITIPFSYSRKFEGLYDSIGYPYTINARKLETNDALNLTIEYLNNPKRLKISQANASMKINNKLNDFENLIKNILS